LPILSSSPDPSSSFYSVLVLAELLGGNKGAELPNIEPEAFPKIPPPGALLKRLLDGAGKDDPKRLPPPKTPTVFSLKFELNRLPVVLLLPNRPPPVLVVLVKSPVLPARLPVVLSVFSPF
jgi:hypothetical protein